MKIEWYSQKGYVSRIIETELQRYTNFFENSYKENVEHCMFNIEKFPRWSIISGYSKPIKFFGLFYWFTRQRNNKEQPKNFVGLLYYAMHDITKLFLAKKFSIKIDFNVHKTTIIILREVIKDKDILKLLKIAYKEFMEMANDLSKAKKERTKAQYYTGTEFMREKYKERASNFLYIVNQLNSSVCFIGLLDSGTTKSSRKTLLICCNIVKPYLAKIEEIMQ